MRLAAPVYSDGLRKQTQVRFGGYNALGTEGELCHTENLTCDYYPELAGRPARKMVRTVTAPRGMLGGTELIWIDGRDLHIGDTTAAGFLSASNSEREIAVIGDYVAVWPDRRCYDRASGTARGLGASVTGSMTFKSLASPEGLSDTGNCLDLGVSAELFRRGDAVNITGCVTQTANNVSAIVREVSGNCLYFYDDTFSGVSDASITETSAMVSRDVPALEFVFEHANRLWGCAGATIYASALGDPFNWYLYDGTASDSWATDTGGGGSFTGAISYGGYPRFFKEDRIYTLYGDYPEEFLLQEHNYLGVNAGSGKSLAVVNGLLFFLSKAGPCVYQGGAPSRLADAFGVTHYKNGVGGTDGKKYYLSMQDGNDDWHLFVYDPVRALWMREDDLHALFLAEYDTELYAIDEDGQMMILGRPYRVPAGATDESGIAWEAEFGDIALQSPNRKRITKVLLRIELEQGTSATVSIKYDSAESWTRVAQFQAATKRSVLLPVIPRRWDHIRLRINGTGAARISSLTLETAAGSDKG